MIIENNGAEIASTNYWDTDQGKAGYVYLSVNAGALRFLVGDKHIRSEMLTAQNVEVTFVSATIQCLFDDGTERPYAITIDARLCDRRPPKAESGRLVRVLVYGPEGLAGERPGRVVVP